MTDSLVEMAKDLAMAQIESGNLTPDQLSAVLEETYATLQRLHSAGESRPVQAAADGAADWRRSITRHAVTCLECGATFKQLSSRHLRQHDLDGRSYRVKYGIPRTVSLSARDVLARRREVVKAIRPWEKSPTNLKTQKPVTRSTRKAQPKASAKATPKRSRRATAKKSRTR